jgi:hypothetical protein
MRRKTTIGGLLSFSKIIHHHLKAAYGFPVKTMTESQCVAERFKLYQQL